MSFAQAVTNVFSPSGKAAALAQKDTDVVIVSAVRTAVTKVRSLLYFLVYLLTNRSIAGEEGRLQGYSS